MSPSSADAYALPQYHDVVARFSAMRITATTGNARLAAWWSPWTSRLTRKAIATTATASASATGVASVRNPTTTASGTTGSDARARSRRDHRAPAPSPSAAPSEGVMAAEHEP